jgi:hypothetical protein
VRHRRSESTYPDTSRAGRLQLPGGIDLTTTAPPQPTAGPTAEEFADKLFNAALGTMETFNLYLGDRLGWLDALAEEPATAAELTERTKTQPR